MAFTNPSTNSYRRLIPGYEAPVCAIYSVGNRSAAIRIPKYANRAESARFEFRPPDATCNPYLAIAAQLLAGVDGIRRNLDPSALGFGPVDEDIFAWPADKRAQIKALPTSLEEAMDALEARPGVPAGGRCLQHRPHRALDRPQAHRGARGPQPPAPLRDRTVLRAVAPHPRRLSAGCA